MKKKFAIWIILCSFLTMTFTGCAYEKSYLQYATAQSSMASSAGPTVTFHPNGQLASVGNPMIAMAMMQMKAPKDAWEALFDFLKFATPFAAIWGVTGALANMGHTNSTNVSGSGNLIGNTSGPAGGASSWASPVTTTTTTTEVVGLPVE